MIGTIKDGGRDREDKLMIKFVLEGNIIFESRLSPSLVPRRGDLVRVPGAVGAARVGDVLHEFSSDTEIVTTVQLLKPAEA